MANMMRIHRILGLEVLESVDAVFRPSTWDRPQKPKPNKSHETKTFSSSNDELKQWPAQPETHQLNLWRCSGTVLHWASTHILPQLFEQMLKTFSFLRFALPSQDANIKPAAVALKNVIQFTCLMESLSLTAMTAAMMTLGNFCLNRFCQTRWDARKHDLRGLPQFQYLVCPSKRSIVCLQEATILVQHSTFLVQHGAIMIYHVDTALHNLRARVLFLKPAQGRTSKKLFTARFL